MRYAFTITKSFIVKLRSLDARTFNNKNPYKRTGGSPRLLLFLYKYSVLVIC